MDQFAKTDSPDPLAVPAAEMTQSSDRSGWIGWSSFFFAVVQSVCSAFVALSGLRILIGAAAFGSALGLLKIADKLHFNAIRIPMMLLALLGSLFNLVAIWQVHRLRQRSASAWRQKPLTSKKLNSERLQLALSVLTLVLLAFEYYFHHKLEKG
jgi:cytochrome bd-type quinol oxidase subunit 2